MPIVLDATTKSLYAVLTAAKTTNNLIYVASYADQTTTTFTPGDNTGNNLDGTTARQIVAAPAASTQRMVKEISIYNADTVDAIVTVYKDISGTVYNIITWRVAPNQTLQYNESGWHVESSKDFPIGTVVEYVGSAAPGGWLLLQGGTIGDASSGASSRANADTQTLFELLWNSMADAQAPVVGGRGASATADFNAHKKITLLDLRGRGVIGTGTGSGLTARTHGATDGTETHTLTKAQIPPHKHQSWYFNFVAGGAQGNGSYYPGLQVDTTDGSADGLAGEAHNNMQPWLALNFIIKY